MSSGNKMIDAQDKLLDGLDIVKTVWLALSNTDFLTDDMLVSLTNTLYGSITALEQAKSDLKDVKRSEVQS